MPNISVIVPVYKVEPYLHRCVDSILSQTYEDFELILVDDGSPDNCPAICDEYAAKDSRVVVIHQENGGLSAARNAGIDWAFANSDSQWLTFVDSDDWVHPEYLECLLGAVVTHHTAVSICGYLQTHEDVPSAPCLTKQAQLWNPESFFIQQSTNATIAYAKLYARTCFSNVRYPVGKTHEDEFVTYKILFALDSVSFISTPLYFYFQRPDSIMGQPWNPRRLDILDAFWERLIFCSQSKYDRMLHKTSLHICHVLSEYQKQIARSFMSDREKNIHLQTLRRWARRVLFTWRDVFPFHQNYWIYEFAFPHSMHVYWLWISAKKKIRKLGEK